MELIYNGTIKYCDLKILTYSMEWRSLTLAQ